MSLPKKLLAVAESLLTSLFTYLLISWLLKYETFFSVITSFQAIPFLLELRSVLDWVCTDTTLTLYHWLKMEDIYANIYVLKCYRESEKVRIDFLRCWAVIKLFAQTLSFDRPTLVSSLGNSYLEHTYQYSQKKKNSQ